MAPMKKTPLSADTATKLMQFAHRPDFPVNIGKSLVQGGSGLYNFNATEEDVSVVVTVLKEINCGCLYVVPFPCFGVYPWDGSVLGMDTQNFMRELEKDNVLCIHQHAGGSRECRVAFKELMIQENLAVNPGSIPVSTAIAANHAISEIMKKD